MDKKRLKLGKQTVRRLGGSALSGVRGARDGDNDTVSGYPVCWSYYGSCGCDPAKGTALCTITSVDACR
jgi:hypothetical protein